MSETPAPSTGAPATGNPAPVTGNAAPATGNGAVDAALAEVVDLSDTPLADHAARFQAAHEVLGRVLETSRDHVQAPIPGVPGPRP